MILRRGGRLRDSEIGVGGRVFYNYSQALSSSTVTRNLELWKVKNLSK
jgi:hypothetical protein